MEPHQRSPLSPAGQVDAAGDLARGWRTNRTGRRRALRMLVWLLVAVLVATALVWLLAR